MVVTSFAGSYNASSLQGGTDGFGSAATFSSPSGIGINLIGDLFVSDQASVIRKISSQGDLFHCFYFSVADFTIFLGEVTTFAGSSLSPSFNGDGQGTLASFNIPGDIIVDANGNVIVSDFNSVRKISSSGENNKFYVVFIFLFELKFLRVGVHFCWQRRFWFCGWTGYFCLLRFPERPCFRHCWKYLGGGQSKQHCQKNHNRYDFHFHFQLTTYHPHHSQLFAGFYLQPVFVAVRIDSSK